MDEDGVGVLVQHRMDVGGSPPWPNDTPPPSSASSRRPAANQNPFPYASPIDRNTSRAAASGSAASMMGRPTTR